MKKKYFITTGTVFIGLILILISYSKVNRFFTIRDGFNVTIYNNTNTQINGLKITYHNITKDIEVPLIEPNQKIILNVIPSENFIENQMKIKYADSNGNTQIMVIVGYFEQGYSGDVTVKILSRDNVGFLIFDIDENIRVY